MTKIQDKSNSSYKSILKGASLFGGTQVFQVLIDTVRSKFVAAILGPAGWGISGLFSSSSASIVKLCSLGLNLAITKEVAQNGETSENLRTVLTVARHLLFVTAVLGLLTCFLFSRLLSLSTFDSPVYTTGFILLSVYIFFTIAGNGELSVLQGLREAKRITKASIIGSVTGLVIGVPMYYFWGTDGIVPAMCVLSVTLWAFNRYSVSKCVKLEKESFTRAKHWPLVKKIVLIGLVLMASDTIGSFTTYLAQIFIRHFSDLSIVGLYTSSTMMTTKYSSVVFTAMAMDYLPRLSKAADDNAEMNTIVNRQTEIVSLIITPVVLLFILFAPLVIRVLLTGEFMRALPLMRWMALGVTFKALMYPLGYVAFAKDNKRLFFWLEGITGNFLTLGLSCVFFYFYGLIGLGYAMVADGAICLVIYYVINRNKYSYRFNGAALRCMIMAIIFSVLSLIISLSGENVFVYIMLSVIVAVSGLISGFKLRRLLKVKE